MLKTFGKLAEYRPPGCYAMEYTVKTSPFRYRQLMEKLFVAVSRSGDYTLLSKHELDSLLHRPASLPIDTQIELKSRFFLENHEPARAIKRLILARQAAKRETISSGPSLHIIVPTIQCAHSCRYCQVSRALDGDGYTMSLEHLEKACDSIFESQAKALTVEFQGGDPLIRFDLVKHAIQRIQSRNHIEKKRLRFVIASTLHQLDEEMCAFLKENKVYLSTSIDGPASLHNRNRPIPGKNSYERTLAGINLARKEIGQDCVAALMTTTKESLSDPEAIVDEYVRLGFRDIFIRPLSSYGFAKRNQASLSYSVNDFLSFYQKALDRVLYWNKKGVEIREVYASIILNKILSTFDAGYVDLQSPTGAGQSVLVYNYDGYVYPSDEARMLAESGDTTLRLGTIGTPLSDLSKSKVQEDLINASLVAKVPGCVDCAYNAYCAPNPVDAHAQMGTSFVHPHQTEHCQKHMQLFDLFFIKLHSADYRLMDIAHSWAHPIST